MPIEVLPDSGEPPVTYHSKPDLRFGTTFLSNKNRDYAVLGESLQDKETGEMFVKRPSDGRVISFFHNEKYTRDLMMSLRIVLNVNSDWTYPKRENSEALFLNVDYDLNEINDSKEVDITTGSFVIPNDDVIYHNLKFKLSRDTNGFVARVTSRNTDKSVIGWLCNQYNYLVETYSGSDSDWLREQDKLRENPKLKDTDSTISCEANITDQDGNVTHHTFSKYVRANEESYVAIPQRILNKLGDDNNFDNPIEIIVTEIKCNKIDFLLSHMDDLTEEWKETYAKFKTPDDKILLTYLNISRFVDNSYGIDLYNNEFVVTLLDIDYVIRYINKMGTLQDPANFIISSSRPDDEIWKPNSVWAEWVSDTFPGNVVVSQPCGIDIKFMERYLFSGQQHKFARAGFDNVPENVRFNIDDIHVEIVND